MVKNPPASAGDLDLIPDLGGFSGEGNDNPLQFSCLGNPTDRRAWRATLHGIAIVRCNLVTKQQVFFYPVATVRNQYMIVFCCSSTCNGIGS